MKLRNFYDNVFKSISERMDDVRNELDSRFSKLDEKFNLTEKDFNDLFKDVNDKFNKVKEEGDKLFAAASEMIKTAIENKEVSDKFDNFSRSACADWIKKHNIDTGKLNVDEASGDELRNFLKDFYKKDTFDWRKFLHDKLDGKATVDKKETSDEGGENIKEENEVNEKENCSEDKEKGSDDCETINVEISFNEGNHEESDIKEEKKEEDKKEEKESSKEYISEFYKFLEDNNLLSTLKNL